MSISYTQVKKVSLGQTPRSEIARPLGPCTWNFDNLAKSPILEFSSPVQCVRNAYFSGLVQGNVLSDFGFSPF